MKILILGGDGYLGWPTAMHFSNRGDEVAVLDNFAKRGWELENGIKPLINVPTLHSRIKRWHEVTGKDIELFVGDLCNHRYIYNVLKKFTPDAIIHYGEQPSAPYSMQSREKAVYTQENNVIGNLNLMFAMERYCPNAHLIKLGTMGEYGTPNIDIEEGWLDVYHNGRTEKMLYPKKPHSFYHLSKVHDSHNIEFACRVWGLRATDLNQGCVYGLQTNETEMDPMFLTSFHYDDIFGTVLNRFLVQASVGSALTVYGSGKQTRGFLNIRDTIRCVELSVENPADPGDLRIFNQFTEQFSVMQLAEKVIAVGQKLGLNTELSHLENPRVEQEDHYYNAKHSKLVDLGLDPYLLTDDLLKKMLLIIKENSYLVDKDFFKPRVKWHKSI